MSLLELRGVSVQLGKATVLREASLSVSAGEFVGLLGPNGAGKTTLLRVAAGLVAPARGSVRIDGVNAAELEPARLALTLAYLPHGAPCHWPMPVRRIVALGRLPHLPAWHSLGAADAAAIEGAMQRADVAAFADRRVDLLSAGEQSRALIARALAQEPKLLLADEPTVALDPYHQLRVMELLRGVADGGGAVLAVFHDLPLAARFCTRVALLSEGRILGDGPPASVLTADNVRSAYGVEIAREQATAFALPGR
ncbi:MAG: ABC transporter ATP-binding protein [Alphaproteobacteria bacterium]|nr:ABC transporter ATP-binding protein [Alphaproteobacteria bacterium]